MATDKSTLQKPQGIHPGFNIGTYEWWPAEDRIIWSPTLCKMYGMHLAPETERDFGALLHPEDRTRVEGETSGFLGSDVASYSHTFRIVRPDGKVRLIVDRGVIERDSAGLAVRIHGLNIDITEDSQRWAFAANQQHPQDGRYRKLLDAIDEGFCIVEVRLDRPDGRIDYRVVEANPAFYEKTGFAHSILGAWLREAAPDLEEHWFETYGAVARDGKPVRFESASDILGRWFDVFAFPIDEPQRRHVGILFNDISLRKREEEHARQVVDEINHRSKNMLGVIQAIARHTSANGDADFLQRFGERVRALASSNDLLAKNRWSAVSLAELVHSQVSPFAGRARPRLRVEGPPLSLSPVATKALGMAFHELATNAAKYGALSNSDGHVVVSWVLDREGADNPVFRMSWREQDGPPVTEPSRQGFGSKVTSVMVESSTNGKVTATYAPTGLIWRFDCEVGHILAPGS